MLLVVATAVIAFSPACLPCGAYSAVFAEDAASEETVAATSITGYPRKLNKSIGGAAKFSATISPADGGRTVRLQRYDTSAGKWVTIKKKVTDDAASAKVAFSIAARYRDRTTSRWRLYVNSSDTAGSALSREITITTLNLEKVSLSARTACIYCFDYDGKGTFLYNQAMNKRRPQASTTKMMTSVLLMESGKIGTVTKISKHAANTPYSNGHLAKGDKYYSKDLMYAMMLPSANDAATAVAEKVRGSESSFVSMMNARAKEIGLKNTHYVNPHGLDADGHYSTAADVAKLTAYAFTFPEIADCMATKSKTIYCINRDKSWHLYTTNSIFGYIKNFFGGKTGTTGNAGYCFAGVYKYKKKLYVTVVMGCGSESARWSDTKKLHKYIKKYAAGTY